MATRDTHELRWGDRSDDCGCECCIDPDSCQCEGELNRMTGIYQPHEKPYRPWFKNGKWGNRHDGPFVQDQWAQFEAIGKAKYEAEIDARMSALFGEAA